MMKDHSSHRWLVAGLLLITLAFAGGALTGGRAGALADPVSIGSVTRPVGLTGTVKLQAHDISLPKLGAWQINVTYAPAILDATSCYSLAGVASCNVNFTTNTVRLVGTASSGLSGAAIDLATLDFKCQAAGVSPLTLTVEQFADTDGGPIPHSVQNGTITCSLSVGGMARLPDEHSSRLRSSASSHTSRSLAALFGAGAMVAIFGASIWLISLRRRAG
jgi:hypothetical protein